MGDSTPVPRALDNTDHEALQDSVERIPLLGAISSDAMRQSPPVPIENEIRQSLEVFAMHSMPREPRRLWFGSRRVVEAT